MKRIFLGLQKRWQQKREEHIRCPWQERERLIRQGPEIFRDILVITGRDMSGRNRRAA